MKLESPFCLHLPRWQIHWASPSSGLCVLSKDEASHTCLLLKSQFFLSKMGCQPLRLLVSYHPLVFQIADTISQFSNVLTARVYRGWKWSCALAAVGIDRFPKEINYISFSLYCLLYSLLILLCWLLVVDFSVAWFPLNHNSFCKC